MFKWIDYEENTCLFIEGINTNVAVLRYKDFQLTDVSTGNKFKMKSSCVDEAKVDSENFLKTIFSYFMFHKVVNFMPIIGMRCFFVWEISQRN